MALDIEKYKSANREKSLDELQQILGKLKSRVNSLQFKFEKSRSVKDGENFRKCRQQLSVIRTLVQIKTSADNGKDPESEVEAPKPF